MLTALSLHEVKKQPGNISMMCDDISAVRKLYVLLRPLQGDARVIMLHSPLVCLSTLHA